MPPLSVAKDVRHPLRAREPDAAPHPGDAVFVSRAGMRRYENPFETIEIHRIEEVLPALRRIQMHVDAGAHAAGFLSYEAAPAFDPAFRTHAKGSEPLLWFSLYRSCTEQPAPVKNAKPIAPSPKWHASISKSEYKSKIEYIRSLIGAGDTYQTNYTFPMRADFEGDAYALFEKLCAAQPCDYSTYIDSGRFKILSLSPELFFRLDGHELTTKPMKGTAPRGLSHEQDRKQARALSESAKDRAENVMIVDLLRNDMGRISETNSVEVTSLFDVEQFSTLWQMTSTITSTTNSDAVDVLAALFPSGSVTGAPKIRTMEIIRDLEDRPRGAYCGAVGWIAPGGRAEFNVAIRTLTVDTQTQTATYPVGSGITWDSSAEAEYDECCIKSAVLESAQPEFELLESLRWDGDYFLLERHLGRLKRSAQYFDIAVDSELVRKRLAEFAHSIEYPVAKVRLRIARDAAISIDAESIPHNQGTLRAGFAKYPVNPDTPFWHHKTTLRSHYDEVQRAHPTLDHVILWTEDGYVTESTSANIVIRNGDRWLTPALSLGLLRGTMREELLERREITEAPITRDDVLKADEVCLINSVRKWIKIDAIRD